MCLVQYVADWDIMSMSISSFKSSIDSIRLSSISSLSLTTTNSELTKVSCSYTEFSSCSEVMVAAFFDLFFVRETGFGNWTVISIKSYFSSISYCSLFYTNWFKAVISFTSFSTCSEQSKSNSDSNSKLVWLYYRAEGRILILDFVDLNEASPSKHALSQWFFKLFYI